MPLRFASPNSKTTQSINKRTSPFRKSRAPGSGNHPGSIPLMVGLVHSKLAWCSSGLPPDRIALLLFFGTNNKDPGSICVDEASPLACLRQGARCRRVHVALPTEPSAKPSSHYLTCASASLLRLQLDLPQTTGQKTDSSSLVPCLKSTIVSQLAVIPNSNPRNRCPNHLLKGS